MSVYVCDVWCHVLVYMSMVVVFRGTQVCHVALYINVPHNLTSCNIHACISIHNKAHQNIATRHGILQHSNTPHNTTASNPNQHTPHTVSTHHARGQRNASSYRITRIRTIQRNITAQQTITHTSEQQYMQANHRMQQRVT